MHDLFNRTVLVNVLNLFQETSFVTLKTIEYLLQNFCCQTFRLELNKLFSLFRPKLWNEPFHFRHLAKNTVFLHDVTAAILEFQNNKTAAMMVSQTNPVGVELFSYENALFCSNKYA